MSIALVGGTLIDATGRDPLPGATVLVEGGKIAWAGPSRQASLPRDCRKVDASGCSILPGLMDLHVHLCYGRSDPEAWSWGVLPPLLDRPLTLVGIKGFARARRTLDMGFTTLRDVGDVGYLGVSLRDAIESGAVEGPRIVACGPYLNSGSGHGNAMPPWLQRTDVASNAVDGVDAILRHVRAQVHMKCDWIKVTATGGATTNTWDEAQFTDAEIEALISEAHRKKRPVAAHCVQAGGALQVVKAGVDTVEHGVTLTPETVELMASKGTYLVPTLAAPVKISENGLELGMAPERVENCRRVAQTHIDSVRMALQAGVRVACGTDSGFGPVFHGENAVELELLVRKVGMSPMQAIMAATREAAGALRRGDLGTIEAGKAADIIAVRGDPLEDIRLLQKRDNIVLVMKAGGLFRTDL